MMMAFVVAEKIVEFPVGMDHLEYDPAVCQLFKVPVNSRKPDGRKTFLELRPYFFRAQIDLFTGQNIENGKPFWGYERSLLYHYF